jgi:hypothetical protein
MAIAIMARAMKSSAWWVLSYLEYVCYLLNSSPTDQQALDRIHQVAYIVLLEV